MKTNLERLQFINTDLFYCITIWHHEVQLQGTISSELIKYCTIELGVKLEVNEEGWLIGKINTIELGNLKITLT